MTIRPDIFCPVHGDVNRRIDGITSVQTARHCEAHEVQIESLMASDKEQWVEINKLKWYVYLGVGGVGASAFFGSIIGNIIVVWMRGLK